MKDYTINHATTTIICTKKFYENASQFGTPECKLCGELRAAFPSYTFSIRAIKTNENKRTANKSLTFVNMVRYIASQPNAVDNLAEFAKIRNLSGQKGNRAFHAVRTWFLGKYPAFVLPGVSEQERKDVEWFITANTARELLAEFANCETMEDVRDVISTHFDDTDNKIVPMVEKAS